MKVKKYFFLYIVCVLPLNLFAEVAMAPLQLPQYNFPKLYGAGGPYTTQQVGFQTLFTNPALISGIEKKWNILSVVADATMRNTKLSSTATVNAVGPIAFGLTNKNFAFGIFNVSRMHTVLNVNSKTADSTVGEELFLTGAYGGSVYNTGKHRVDLGIQMKGYFQSFSIAKAAAVSSTNMDFTQVIKETSGKSNPIMFTFGMGLDVGFVYTHNNTFRLGLTVRDLYTATFSTMYENFDKFKKSSPSGQSKYRGIIPTISSGVSFSPRLPESYATFTGYTCWFEYHDFLSPLKKQKIPIYYNFALGMEFEFNEAYYLRLGFANAAPTVGIGIDATYFELNAAFVPWKHFDPKMKSIDPWFGVDISVKL